MPETTDSLLQKALALDPNERAALVNELLASLDAPDAAIDAAWLEEVTNRIKAYRAGEIRSIPADEVLRENAWL